MATHRYDPYLWVHLAGIATVPLWLVICALGLAVGSPQWSGLELALLVGLGVSPALFMQLGRPFYIFSLLALTLKSTALSDDQRRLLTLFQQWWVKGLAVAAPVPLVWLLWEIYPRAVVASDITPFAPWGRLGGLAVAAGSFAMANLFLQVPVSVLAVMATSDKRFQRTAPYPVGKIQADFTQAGLPLGKILPSVIPPDAAISSAQDQDVADEFTNLDSQVSQGQQATMDDIPLWAEALQPQPQPALAEAIVEITTEDTITEDIVPDFVDSSLGVDTATVDHTLDEASADEDAIAATDISAMVEDGAVDSQGDREDSVEPHEATEIAVENTADNSVSQTQDAEDWDQGKTDWDQASREWDQDKTWEGSAETAKDRTIEVAVVRISDPS